MPHAITNLNVRTKTILVVLCIAIGLGNTYVPLPIAIEKDLSVPFPCQSKGCGCANAKQCWSSCCCHSNAEKLAWAKKNNVDPPAWFLEKVKYTNSTKTASQPKCCCCQKKSKCCQTSSKSCCEDVKSKCEPQSHPTHTVMMTLKEQRGCHGADDGLAELNLKLIPIDLEPVANSAHSEALCCMEPSFVSFCADPPEPIPESRFCRV